jgi:DNA-binding Xre family transcriptional regulator
MVKIALTTIDALCEALGCEPGDLVVRVAGKKKQGSNK